MRRKEALALILGNWELEEVSFSQLETDFVGFEHTSRLPSVELDLV